MTYVYDDVTYVYDDVTYVYDDVLCRLCKGGAGRGGEWIKGTVQMGEGQVGRGEKGMEKGMERWMDTMRKRQMDAMGCERQMGGKQRKERE